MAYPTASFSLWGLVAWRTGDIRRTTVLHVLFDASGFGALLYLS